MPSKKKKNTTKALSSSSSLETQPTVPLPSAIETSTFASPPAATSSPVPAPSTSDTAAISNGISATNFDVAFFLEHAKSSELARFVEAASQTSDGRNLHLLWTRAVAHGKKEGTKIGFREAVELGLGTTPAPVLESFTPETPSVATSPAALVASISDFFAHEDTTHVQDFLARLQLQPTESGLKGLWDRAFAEGHARGREEGIREDEERVDGLAVSDILKIGFEKGNVLGIVAEREIWETAGHSNRCPCIRRPTTVDMSVQTMTPSTTSVNASTQTSLPQSTELPSYAVAPVQTTSTLFHPPQTLMPVVPPILVKSAHCDWADDPPPTSVSLFPACPVNPGPRDFSCLRSSTTNPFASLRHRSKRSAPPSTNPSCQGLYRHPFRRARRIRNGPRHYASQSMGVRVAFTPPPGDLNWEADPRLSDLSRALVSLGWVRR